MTKTTTAPATNLSHPADVDDEPSQIKENISAVYEFYTREEDKIRWSQRVVESASHIVGKPIFLGVILLFVAGWIAINVAPSGSGIVHFDPTPFPLLQGIICLLGLLTTTVVLSKQNRLARLAERREHLDLKVALLTEQKVTKLIDLMEELRRDLPNVKDRHDPDAVQLQQAMNAEQVLAALDEGGKPQPE